MTAMFSAQDHDDLDLTQGEVLLEDLHRGQTEAVRAQGLDVRAREDGHEPRGVELLAGLAGGVLGLGAARVGHHQDFAGHEWGSILLRSGPTVG